MVFEEDSDQEAEEMLHDEEEGDEESILEAHRTIKVTSRISSGSGREVLTLSLI